MSGAKRRHPPTRNTSRWRPPDFRPLISGNSSVGSKQKKSPFSQKHKETLAHLTGYLYFCAVFHVE
jgi:hypothetical protein